MTQQYYAAVGQLGQILAREASTSAARTPACAVPFLLRPVGDRADATASCREPAAGRVALGPGTPHLYLFFDTWDQEVTSLAASSSP